MKQFNQKSKSTLVCFFGFRTKKEAITEAVKAALKQTDEVAEQVTETTIKTAEQEAAEKAAQEAARITSKYDEISQSGHAVQRHGEQITEPQLDDRAMRGIDPASGTTNDAYNTFPDGTPKPHNHSKDATKFTSKEALVKAEEYVKNSQKYNDELAEVTLAGGNKVVIKDLKLEDVFGANYKDQVFGKTRLGSKNNPTGTTETDFTDGTLRAVYEKDSNGEWVLETIFPEPKQ